MPIRVMIADDHPLVRLGLRSSIERSGKDVQVVAEAADGVEVLAMAAKTPADVYVLDISMPERNGIDTMRELIGRDASTKVIILSFHSSQAMVEQAMTAGARGYLTKETATQTVVDAIEQVYAGRFYLSPDIAHFVVDGYLGRKPRKRGSAPVALTGQERKVLQLIAEGHSNKEIATLLGVAENTVHTHRNHVMAKLDLHKQADLVRYAVREGIAKA